MAALAGEPQGYSTVCFQKMLGIKQSLLQCIFYDLIRERLIIKKGVKIMLP